MGNAHERAREIRRHVRASFETSPDVEVLPTFESIQKAVVTLCEYFDSRGLEVESAKIRGFIDGLFYSGPIRPEVPAYMIGFDHGRDADQESS